MPAEAIIALVILLLILLFFAVIISSMVFWIWMIVDCANRKMKENDKIVWILIIVLIGILGAIIYYFVIKRKK